MMRSQVDVLLVFVGINSWDYVKGCFESLRRTEWGDLSHAIVYVDNASSDGSVENVRSRFPEVEVIVNDSNVGFCRACNQGAAFAQSKYIFYQNNDTITCPDTIPLLVDFIEQTPKAGAVGCRLLNPDLTDQWSARRFPTWKNGLFGRHSFLTSAFPESRVVRHYLYKDEMREGRPFQVDWVPGSCTLARRAAVADAGGFHEDLHYWSDAVFCDRLRQKGWGVYLVPQSTLIHYEGQGSGVRTYDTSKWLIRDFHRGAYAFYCEHHNLTRWNPLRWIAAAALTLRSQLLLCANWMARARRG